MTDPSPGHAEAVERRRVARRAARVGGAVAADHFGTAVALETKATPTDYVSEADADAQRAAAAVLRDASDAPVVGEEDGERSTLPPRGPVWVVDPIDGTNNFVRERPEWVTSIAAVDDGEPVAAATVAPMLSTTTVAGADRTRRNGAVVTTSDRTDPAACMVAPTVYWERDRREEYAGVLSGLVERFGDIRRPGSVQLVLAAVAAGALDGAVTTVATNPWDTIAGVHLVRRAGGRVTDLHDERWQHDSVGLVASNGEPAVHDALLAAVADWA
jgi:myo-inositol-1(or 4)-monophosphatase